MKNQVPISILLISQSQAVESISNVLLYKQGLLVQNKALVTTWCSLGIFCQPHTHTHTKRINRLTSLIVLILIQGCWDGDHEQEGGTWSVHWTFFLSAGSILTGRRQPKIVSSIIRYPSSHSSNREIINPTIWRGRNHHTVVWLVFNSKMWPLLYYFSTVAPLRFMNVGLTYTHLDSRSRSQPIQNMYTVKKKKQTFGRNQ